MLNGPNPMKLMNVCELPENFPVNGEMVEPYLEEGKSLQEELDVTFLSYIFFNSYIVSLLKLIVF